MSSDSPLWDDVLTAAARLQTLLPDAVLVGGTGSALYAGHRVSFYADHVLTDLRERFDRVLADLEAVAGWQTARVQRPVLILGSLDGIETGVRQLIRSEPLETTEIERAGVRLRVSTREKMLRIKAILILRRNATRDYLDFLALAETLGAERVGAALTRFDALYPQPSGESALQQLQAQLANALPYDLEQTDLRSYRQLLPRWQDWQRVRGELADWAVRIFDGVCEPSAGRGDHPSG
jgi:hypothetical protein